MAPMLNRLPIELLELITEQLDLKGLHNLRLTSRAQCDQSTLAFSKHLRLQRIVLDRNSLEDARALANHRVFNSAVKSVKIVVPIYKPSGFLGDGVPTSAHHTDDELASAAEGLRWLYQKYDDQERMMTDGSDLTLLVSVLQGFVNLRCLTLIAEVVEGRQNQNPRTALFVAQTQVWLWAAHAYRITMLALAQSSSSLTELLLYKDTPRCSISTFDIAACMPTLKECHIESRVATIKNIALSVSTRKPTDFTEFAERLRINMEERAESLKSRVLGNSDSVNWLRPVAYTLIEEGSRGIIQNLTKKSIS